MTKVRRVLVVEDNADVREMLRLQLEFAGYAVDLAGDGVAALDVLASRVPDAMVVDLLMPGMDGGELCRRVRADGALPVIPVMLYSAVAGDDPRIQDVLDLPRVVYQGKGASVREMVGTLATLVDEREAAPEPSA